MTRAAIYIRVSTEEQALHGYSLEAQQDALERYVKAHDLYVVGRYADEGASARKPYSKRPGFMRMLDDVKADRLDLILFIKLDRWFRSVRDYYKVQDVLEAHGVGWKAIMENYDTTTAAGRLHINIMLSVAQDEADRTSERIKFVFRDRLQRGEFAAGAIPLGYKLVDKHLVVDPEKAPAIQALFEFYDQNHNLAMTTRMLRDQYGINYYTSAIKSILCKSVYKGEYHGVPNFCDPLVPADLYDRVQRALEANIKRCPSGRIYLFSALIRCQCGFKMAAKACGHNHYYRCRQRAEGLCGSQNVSEIKLEKFLLENLSLELERQIGAAKTAAAQRKRTGPDKAQIKAKLGRLKDLYVNGLIDMDAYRQDYDSLTAQLQAAEAQAPDPQPNVVHLEAILRSDPLRRYESRTPEERQALWHSVIREIQVDAHNNVTSIVFQ